MLGLDVDQVAIIDFDGFRDFIDTIGGITVDLPTPVCSEVSGGAFNLNLEAGEHDLDGFQAITLARTRSNSCGEGEFAASSDIRPGRLPAADPRRDQGQADQHHRRSDELHQGPADRLERTEGDGLEHGHADDAPVRGLGGDRGGGDSDVLKPSGTTGAGNLVVSPEECERAAEKLLGDEPPRQPNCPQG